VSTIPVGSVNEILIVEFVLPVAVKLLGAANNVLYEIDNDEGEFPFPFVATILRVYVIPLCSPLIVYEVAGALKV
jgi:hypothetical protein